MKPTLKSVLIRVLKIAARVVASIIAFTLIMALVNEIRYPGTTLWGVLLFAATLTIILVNLRRVTQPIKLSVVALYIATVAAVIMLHKLEYTWWGAYSQIVLMTNIIAVLLSAFMPLLRGLKAERFARAGKIALLAAVLMLDFAMAFPEIKFDDFRTQGAYTGVITIKNGRLYLADKDVSDATVDRKPYQQRVFAFVSNWRSFGYDGVYQTVQVMIPTDSTCREYRSRAYRHYRNEDFMVHTSERDTIWLNEERIYIPNRNRMTNIELIQLRHQWQYDMWHRLKRFLHLFTDRKKQHSENIRYGIKYDPVEDTFKYKAIEKQVEREIQEALKDVPRGLGFCHRYWAVKQEILIRHGIKWRSPAEMNPDIMFD